MDDIVKLDEAQIDGLREISNIGAGHAATALSQMTGHSVMISVPDLDLVGLSEVARFLGIEGKSVVAVSVQMFGDLTGRTLLVIDDTHAAALSNILLGRSGGGDADLDDMAQSSLTEAGNIVAAAYLHALAKMMGMVLLQSIPEFKRGDAGELLSAESLEMGGASDPCLCIRTEFHFRDFDEGLEGYYVIFPDRASLDAILDAIRLR